MTRRVNNGCADAGGRAVTLGPPCRGPDATAAAPSIFVARRQINLAPDASSWQRDQTETTSEEGCGGEVQEGEGVLAVLFRNKVHHGQCADWVVR